MRSSRYAESNGFIERHVRHMKIVPKKKIKEKENIIKIALMNINTSKSRLAKQCAIMPKDLFNKSLICKKTLIKTKLEANPCSVSRDNYLEAH